MEQVQRVFLYAALFVVAFFLWQSWNKYYTGLPKQAVEITQQHGAAAAAPGGFVDKTGATASTGKNDFTSVPAINASEQTTPKAFSQVPASRIIKVHTDVFNIGIDSKGGNIVSLKLLKYAKTMKKDSDPLVLLTNSPEKLYIAESALIGENGPDSRNNLAEYKSSTEAYKMSGDTLDVNLTWTDGSGLDIVKTYTFTKNSYLIKVSYKISNNGKTDWTGRYYTQITRKEIKETGDHLFQIHPYFGAAISSPDKRYHEISFKDMKSEPLNKTIENGWAAMVQRYFLSAWIPDSTQKFDYYSKVDDGDIYTIGMASKPITVAPGQTMITSAKFYSGPEITSVLKGIAPGLEQTVSYGWLWFISVIVFWVMSKIYFVVGNWGWSIILVTVLIKLMFFPLSAKSYKSMAKMRGLQPKIKALRDRYADDKQQQSKSMMELYKKEKVNPVGGCLPILVQIPVFFALYMVLIESVQLRHAPWILWIHDLSVPDPLFILPVLMGITMFVQQKLNPPPPDPTQAKVMMFLPVVFTVLFAYFPAGLVLYWVVNNALSILQQWHITRQVERDEKLHKHKKKK
jgi:YidC/Oxa1 family membrane protein insertase